MRTQHYSEYVERVIQISLTYLHSNSHEKAQPNRSDVALGWKIIEEIIANKGVNEENPEVSC